MPLHLCFDILIDSIKPIGCDRMNYKEEMDVAAESKKEYVQGLDKLIEERQKAAEIVRTEYLKDIFTNPEKYREDFKRMLGWPLVDYTADCPPKATMEKLSEEEGYTIYRVKFEILDGLFMTGLFFKVEGDKKPLVIVQHGGTGTPEKISGVLGDTSNYNDMLQRVIKHGVHAFAPQLLLWADAYNVPYNRNAVDVRLKRLGSSVSAVEIFGITRILDYFEAQDYVSCFGMVGLSYGGFYTLFTTALDTRIKSAISCSFFNKRDEICWSDWTWFNSGNMFDDAEVAALVYPRRLCIQMGNQDELFNYRYSEESFERIKEICREVGTDWVELIVFDGTHEFCKDDQPIERLIADLNN